MEALLEDIPHVAAEALYHVVQVKEIGSSEGDWWGGPTMHGDDALVGIDDDDEENAAQLSGPDIPGPSEPRGLIAAS